MSSILDPSKSISDDFWNGIMATKISRDILESYLNCRLKGHFKLTGQQGTKCDYELLRTEMRDEVRRIGINKILSSHSSKTIPRNVELTTPALKQGAPFIIDATLEDDFFCLTFDGLKKMDGPSKLGDFHYVPILFHDGPRIDSSLKLLVGLYGFCLARLQGHSPEYGFVWLGTDCKVTKLRLDTERREIARVIDDLKQLRDGATLQKVRLNDHCRCCEFRDQCLSKAAQDDCISLLRGLSDKEIDKLSKKGIFTVTQLAFTFRPRRKRKNRHSTLIRNHSLQAKANQEKTTFVTGTLELPNAPLQLYLDVEGIPDQDFYYLIGVTSFDGTNEKHVQFWADSLKDEEIAWQSFQALFSSLEDFSLFHYGSYESRFISRMSKKYGIQSTVTEKLRLSSTNVLSKLYAHVYLPIYTNDLKTVASFLGFKWTEEGASGLQSVVWRNKWERTRNHSFKQKLIQYNKDDCRALRLVTETLRSIAANKGDSKCRDGAVIQADDLKREHPYGFGRNPFFFPAFDVINKCAYFDYQRERIYVRTCPAVKAGVKREKRNRLKVRINTTVYIDPPRRCEHCSSDSVIKHARLSKVVQDLKLFAGGIKRWVIHYTSSRYLCRSCGKTFMPSSYHAIASCKYGSTLLAWSTYRNIALRQSHGIINHELAEVFGYEASCDIAGKLKKRASQLYETTYSALESRLLKGRLIHADETKVSIKGIGGYVWAFTSLQEVIYKYSDTREDKTAQETLAGFEGVLVSDFYSGYDGLNRLHQKCLIHLMRDINDDLFKNPFDEELKSLARDFSETLAPIIQTIDKFGLRKVHLNKHRSAAERFLHSASNQVFDSPLALNYQRRLSKNREKLFLFLEYDGIPWNNNNAEHAIKRFAFLRRVIGGSSSPNGIKEYLVLLSICETLRLKGVSFLKFLISGTTDVDAFVGSDRSNLSRKV